MASYDLIVIGMGSAGMVAAEFASKLPIEVACAEGHRVGGDCLWTGCVPSKALLASAKAAHTMRHADAYGLPAVAPRSTLPWCGRASTRSAGLASTDDNPDRFRAEGVDVLLGTARLTSPTTVLVGDEEHKARYVLLATGSRPADRRSRACARPASSRARASSSSTARRRASS